MLHAWRWALALVTLHRNIPSVTIKLPPQLDVRCTPRKNSFEIKPESKYHKVVDVYSLGKIFYQLVVGTSDEDEMSDVSDHAYYHTAIQYDRFQGHVFGNLIKSMLKESPKERAMIDAICLKLSHFYSEFDQAAAYA